MDLEKRSVQITLAVAQGTIITSAASAFLTGIYSAFKGNGHPGVLAASAALNGGICAATFFTIRECVISPVLLCTMPTAQYVRRRRVLESSSTSTCVKYSPDRLDKTSWSDLKYHKLLDTSLSGGAAGGLLNGWRGGRRAIIPGIATAALLCGLLQLVINGVGVARIEYLSRLRSGSSADRFLSPSPNTSMLKASHPPPEPIPFVDRIMTSLGLHKLSDEEYLEKLKQTRDGYLMQIRKLEQEGDKERKDAS